MENDTANQNRPETARPADEDRKVAVLLGPGFEDAELRIPTDRLRAAGYVPVIIGRERNEKLAGYKGKEKVRSELSVADASADGFAGLLIPGGHSPDVLRADPRFIKFVIEFDRTRRPVAAVCHGPQLLITAGLVRGRVLTAWPTVQDDLRQIGARVVDEPVVIDGNWITSRKPEDLEAFSSAFIAALDEWRGRAHTVTAGHGDAQPGA
ncbi:MAG TPA: type 1 glutamine amidotransferase domain-containing protein [Polyangia bacterium]|nr:type 1 glutamine amidotransferase domain-containing protein [Polyangia bacterium]